MMKGNATLLQVKADPHTKRLLWHVFAASRGGPNRIKIISILKRRPANTHELSQELGLDYKAIQHHIKVLEKNNLVNADGPRYGRIYCLSTLLEVHTNVFDEIVARYSF